MTLPLLIKSNSLDKKYSNIWSFAPKANFYHPCDDFEEYLKGVMLKAKDVTFQSLELEEEIFDWTSEYHLSYQRANLLRALNLDGVKTALELGCGSGTITRYLGELNINVDAVEGNLCRAEITRLRCRDLENVNVINTNFKELTLPKGEYDAILLIGAVEYAKKYVPSAVDGKEAVINILSLARSALNNGGLLFIAIENRMGLKYWLGASEDHYGKPDVGLYGYPQDQGIRTYDKREWEQLLEQTGIKCYQFTYPFPDYKLTRALLSDAYIKNDEYAYSILYRVSSRDYSKIWWPNSDEFILWESLHQSGYLQDFANSFFIVISDSEERLNKVIPNDFVYFSDPQRKPVYSTMTMKPRDKDYIVKKRMRGVEAEEKDVSIHKNLFRERYIKGPLLSTLWLHSVVECDNALAFEGLIKAYYDFILDYFNKHGGSFDTYDFLPHNIIVDTATGSYRIIDKEWKVRAAVSPGYILFRALMWFAHGNEAVLHRICEIKNIVNAKEFVEYGLSLFSPSLNCQLDKFIEIEEQVQAKIAFQKGSDTVRRMLTEPFKYVPTEMRLQSKTFEARLYWVEENKELDQENSLSMPVLLGFDRQVLVFSLPRSSMSFRYLRFDPADRWGFFHLYNIALKWCDLEAGKEGILWQLRGGQDIARGSEMEGVHFCSTSLGEVFISTGDDPQILFEFPEILKADAGGGILRFEVEMDWPKSVEYLIAEEALGRVMANHAQQIIEHTAIYDRQNRRIHEYAQHVQELTEQIKEQSQHIRANEAHIRKLLGQVSSLKIKEEHVRLSLGNVLNSRSWRLTAPLRWMSVNVGNLKHNVKKIPHLFNWQYKLIRESGLFDTSYYLDRNPDVAESGMNPLAHYLKVGFKEGRDPNPLFETSYYLKENPDVTESGMNPLVHYLEIGAKEGRDPNQIIEGFTYKPTISIITSVFNINERCLHNRIRSVLNQIYNKCELCLVDDGSTKTHVKSILEEYKTKDKRVKTIFAQKNQGMANAFNEGLSLVTGDFVLFLSNYELTIDALYECAYFLNKNPEADLIYSDDDTFDSRGNRIEDFFRLDLLLSMNYFIGHFTLFRKSIISDIGGFGREHDGPQDQDFLLSLIKKTSPERILHIPKRLYS